MVQKNPNELLWPTQRSYFPRLTWMGGSSWLAASFYAVELSRASEPQPRQLLIPCRRPEFTDSSSWFLLLNRMETEMGSLKVFAAAKSLQSCPTLCDPIDGSPPGSPVPGILQARTLEWVAISFSNAEKWKVKVKSLSHVWLLATSWTTAYQAPPSMGFSRQEYWSGVPLPSPIYIHIYMYIYIYKISISLQSLWVAKWVLGLKLFDFD